MQKEIIEARIQRAIKPALDRADALLDYYTEGLPPKAWRPLALRLQMLEVAASFRLVGAAFDELSKSLTIHGANVTSFGRVFSGFGDRPKDKDRFHGSPPMLYL